jgi:myo-inositol-hexaphosphate 3-phosphohydrolase
MYVMSTRHGDNEATQYSRQGTVLYVSHFAEQNTGQILLPKQVFGNWFCDTV